MPYDALHFDFIVYARQRNTRQKILKLTLNNLKWIADIATLKLSTITIRIVDAINQAKRPFDCLDYVRERN